MIEILMISALALATAVVGSLFILGIAEVIKYI